MEYDWAPCPHCGWKVPATWENSETEDNENLVSKTFLAKPHPWVQITVWTLLIITLISLISWIRW